MNKLPTASDSISLRGSDAHRNTALYLILSMADTTWRVFVPTVGLLLLGNYFDDRLHSTPWLLLLGVLIGGGFATLLVRRQLARGGKNG